MQITEDADLLKVVLTLADAANSTIAFGNLDEDLEAAVYAALLGLPREVRSLMDSPVLSFEEWMDVFDSHDSAEYPLSDVPYHVEPS